MKGRLVKVLDIMERDFVKRLEVDTHSAGAKRGLIRVGRARKVLQELENNEASAQSSAVAEGCPKLAEGLLFWLLDRQQREYLIGDLREEYFIEILPRYGRRKAQLWFWLQVIRSILPIIFSIFTRCLLVLGGRRLVEWFADHG